VSTIKLRNGTAASAVANNDTLAPGEAGVVGEGVKVGPGQWNSLFYINPRPYTVTVAAANSRRSIADYCCSTDPTNDINVLNAALADLKTNSSTRGGRLHLFAGDYFNIPGTVASAPTFVFDADRSTISGEDWQGTVLHVPAGLTTPRYATLQIGKADNGGADSQKITARDFGIASRSIGGQVQVSGTGHALVVRGQSSQARNLWIENPELNGVHVESMRTYGTAVTLTQAIDNTAGNETWTVSTTAGLPALNSLALVLPPASATITTYWPEIVSLVSVGSGQITVARQFQGTFAQAWPTGATIQFFTENTMFDNVLSNIYVVYPGYDGFYVDTSIVDHEGHLCKVEGGWKLATPRGRHGFNLAASDFRYSQCHSYFNQQQGWMLRQPTVGGSFGSLSQCVGENNGQSQFYAYYTQVLLDECYGYGSGSTQPTVNIFKASESQVTGGKYYSTGGGCQIVVNTCNAIQIADTQCVGGASNAGQGAIWFQGVTCSNVHDNYVASLSPGNQGSIRLSSSTGCQVHHNQVGNGIIEDGTSDQNGIESNRFINDGVAYTAVIGITLVGANSWKDRNVGIATAGKYQAGVADQVSITAAYTMRHNDHVFAGGAGGYAVTTPPTVQGNYGWVYNDATGAVTLTPSGGTINGGSTISLAAGSGKYIWTDGTNWVAQ
jgi:hypothetical protein